jgi:hypothetical protein
MTRFDELELALLLSEVSVLYAPRGDCGVVELPEIAEAARGMFPGVTVAQVREGLLQATRTANSGGQRLYHSVVSLMGGSWAIKEFADAPGYIRRLLEEREQADAAVLAKDEETLELLRGIAKGVDQLVARHG